MASRVFVVFNPQAGRGRGRRMVEPVLRAFGGRAEHALTTGPGDEARLVREAVQRGFQRVVAVGGDGTWSNVANAILAQRAPLELGLVPAGTGSDFARSLGIPSHDVAACARIVDAGHVRPVDVGTVEGRHFLNVVGFGFDVAVLEDTWRVRGGGGPLLYLYCALRQLRRFRGFELEVSADGGRPRTAPALMFVIANGRRFGGGFRIAPAADLADGRLDAVLFGDLPFHKRLGLLFHLRRGTHHRVGGVSTMQAASYSLRFPSAPAYELDGEWTRAASAELLVATLPAALRVLAPAVA